MAKLTVKDIDVRGRPVFVRVDFNVPIEDGVVGDDTRIRAALPTIHYLLAQQATVILASHLGRPKGKPNPAYSLRPVAEHAQTLIGTSVVFAEDCIGEPARAAVERAGPGGVVLLENLRFHAGEEKNDPAFARALAELAETYVNDAFGAAHRAHASTNGIVKHMKAAAAGLLMANELEYLGQAMSSPERPFVAVLGGAKVSDKLEVIESFLGRVDTLLIGGAMAYTFFKARGVPVGRSLVEEELLDTARTLESRAAGGRVELVLPSDHVVAPRLDADAANEVLGVGDPAIGDRLGLDIGPATIVRYTQAVSAARTVVWNGPMGVFEIPAFAEGTNAVARAVASVRGTTIIGGGDSIAAVTQAGVADRITHISTGGGASLEFLGGRTLPGVEVLPDRRD